MNISVFRNGKKLMCKLPGNEKDTPVVELVLAFMMLSPAKIKAQMGEELPVLVPQCEITEKEKADINKINESFAKLYSK